MDIQELCSPPPLWVGRGGGGGVLPWRPIPFGGGGPRGRKTGSYTYDCIILYMYLVKSNFRLEIIVVKSSRSLSFNPSSVLLRGRCWMCGIWTFRKSVGKALVAAGQFQLLHTIELDVKL